MPKPELKDIFQRYGDVVDIRHSFDQRSGERKKFAFVEFASARAVDELCHRKSVHTDHGILLELGRSVRSRGDGGRAAPGGSTDYSFSRSPREERSRGDGRMEVDERRERKRERSHEGGNSRERDWGRVENRVPYAGRRETDPHDRSFDRGRDRRVEEARVVRDQKSSSPPAPLPAPPLPPPPPPVEAPVEAPVEERRETGSEKEKEEEKEEEKKEEEMVILGDKTVWENGILEHLLHMECIRAQREEEREKARKRM
jgi:hypothetical protein